MPETLPGLINPAALEAGTWTLTDDLRGRVPENERLLCPFHDDRRPSAKVLPGSGRIWCFRCGVAEDRLGVAPRLLFPGRGGRGYAAIERSLASDWLQREGYEVVRATGPRGPRTAPEVEPALLEVVTIFCRLANEHLARDPRSVQELRDTRALNDPVGSGLGTAHWRLLPRVDAACGEAIAGWEERRAGLLVRAGLLTDPARATPARPQRWALADRWVLPEWRGSGARAVFYQARARDRNPARYRSPRLPKQLFGLESLARPTQVVWVTEGAFDALPLLELGESAIATLGTHLAEYGIDALKQAVGGRLVVICHDNDEPDPLTGTRAGEVRAAVLRERLAGAGIACATVRPPAGIKDLSEWMTRAGAERVLARLRFAV